MLRALAAWLHRWARLVALAWLVITAASFALATGSFGNTSLFDRLKAGNAPTVPGEAKDGAALLSNASASGPAVFLVAEGIDPQAAGVREALTVARQRFAGTPNVVSVTDPWGQQWLDADSTPPGAVPGQVPTLPLAPFISTDGEAITVVVELKPDLSASAEAATIDEAERRLDALGAALRSQGADRVLIGGVNQLVAEINHHVETDLRAGEAIALPLSLMVMLVVFAGLLAAGMPILGAIASIGGGLLSLLGFSYVIDLDASVPSVVSVLGLGLCIDYGLLLVSRFREEMLGHTAEPDQVRQALQNTMATAGRTITVSALTVAISLAGLMFFNASVLRAVGAAGTSVVLVALLVALTLVPALLVWAAPRLIRPGLPHRIPGLRAVVGRLGDTPPVQGVFSRLATVVQRHAILVFVACLGLLSLLAWPVTRMNVVNAGSAMLPPESSQRQLFDVLEADFPQISQAPILVVAKVPPAQLDTWAKGLDVENVASISPAEQQGSGPDAVSVLSVRTTTDVRGPQTRAVVSDLRDQRPDFAIWVTGEAAQVHDVLGDIRERAPLAIMVVVLATFVLLFLMTGSLLIPAKALVMNLVSIGASFGVLVWVFQDGHLSSWLNFTPIGIDQNIPALALAFSFGLAMDYEVFLLARVKEMRTRLLEGSAPEVLRAQGISSLDEPGAPSVNDLSVRYGLQRSGRIITSAGLIMVIVFSGFVTGDLLLIKQIGVALSVAVLIDATIVRMLLVPATMTLLGERNWWAPAPLRRLHDRFGITE